MMSIFQSMFKQRVILWPRSMINDPLSLAKSYPYTIPTSSYIFHEGRALEINQCLRWANLKSRTPVLAVGSNQSPVQLARKFKGCHWGAIPVLRMRLDGFNVAYSPHIASYGAIPGTLHEAQNVQVTLFVNWLNSAQLIRMHETEITGANYSFGLLVNLNVEVEVGPPLDSVFTYASTHGTLCDACGPIPIAEVGSKNRRRPGLSQMDIQRFARDKLEPDIEIDQFIRTSINDPDIRSQRSERLKTTARHLLPKSFEEIQT